MTTGPREPETDKPGPFERSPSVAPPPPEARWITDRDRPYIQHDPVTGRLRTNGYTPNTKV